jgi:hypothetical protein
VESHGGIILSGENQRTWSSITLSTTNPTWTARDAILCLHIKRLVTNHLSHNTACNNVKVARGWIHYECVKLT